MNRNSVSRFSLAPQVSVERSTFDRSCSKKFSTNIGSVTPVYWDEILPGDTFRMKTSKIVRMQTLKTPMLDDIDMDVYWFFIPNRLVWEHFREFMGENTESAWIPTREYTVPQIKAPSGGWNVGTIADHLGIPPLVGNISVNALPFRAYALVMNEWFRSTPVQDPLVIPLTDSTVTGTNGTNYITDTAKGGQMFTACRYFDYFSAGLPSPQFGDSVTLQLTQDGTMPVYAAPYPNAHYDFPHTSAGMAKYDAAVKASYPLQFENAYTYSNSTLIPWPKIISGVNNQIGSSFLQEGLSDAGQSSLTNGYMQSFVRDTQDTPAIHSVVNSTLNDIHNAQSPSIDALTPVNLIADFNGSSAMTYTTINELRTAFQIQRWMEKTARGGDRYISILKAHFGVTSPDARLQRPEYLGGNRVRLNIRQITQTSSTTETSPMGDVAGMSVTTDSHYDFEKSFVEHGILLGLAVARYKHTYQQGIPREFLRKTKWDYYWPTLAHLGELPIYNAQIYAQGYDSNDPDAVDYDSQVFAYQEAFAEYRYKPNTVAGMLRSVSNSGLDSWHLADYYTQLPTLSAGWMKEDKTNLDRVLTVTSDVSDQLFADFYFDCKATRCMPLYSIPGLIDHF